LENIKNYLTVGYNKDKIEEVRKKYIRNDKKYIFDSNIEN